MREAEGACRVQGISFLPLVVESHGGWGEVDMAMVGKIVGSP